MKKLFLIVLLLTLTGCSESKTNGNNTFNQEECECRGGDYTKNGSSVVMSGAVGVSVSNYKCYKDGEELYRPFKDETCEKYWELKNEKRYKWS